MALVGEGGGESIYTGPSMEEIREERADEYVASRLFRAGTLIDALPIGESALGLAYEVVPGLLDDYSDEGREAFVQGVQLAGISEVLMGNAGVIDLRIAETRALFGSDTEAFCQWLSYQADAQMLTRPERLGFFERWHDVIDGDGAQYAQVYMGFFSALALLEVSKNLARFDAWQQRRQEAERQAAKKEFDILMKGLVRERRELHDTFDHILYRQVGADSVHKLKRVAELAIVDQLLEETRDTREGFDPPATEEVQYGQDRAKTQKPSSRPKRRAL